MLKKWIAAGNLYIKDMDLEDVAALKCCLLALGTLVGLGIPLKGRKPAAIFASILFIGTYIPLMYKFIALLTHPHED